MLKLRTVTLALAVGGVCLVGVSAAANAQTARQGYEAPNQANHSGSQKSANQSNMAVPARLFAKKAAQDDLAEIKMGKLAEQKGGTAVVRDFGKRIVRDHTKNLDELKTVAQQQNIQLPTEPNETDMITYQDLSKLDTQQFDQKYARDMVNDHVKAVAEFKEEAENGSNTQIKDYAQKSVPVLETHLRLARNMQSSVNAEMAPSGQSGNKL
ncbi:MAG TPA: DUF4142 domain-containing protein [Candidatus Acidoferrum sp.]|nr:DUF4142 domain-containing protein [Candidatus Acidoferrum sp.]